MRMKKFLAVLLCICMMASLCVIGVGAQAQNSMPAASPSFSGGSGTSAAPYKISSVSDLNALATAVNSGESYLGAYFVLTADIDLKNAEFTPIGIAHFPGSTYSDADYPFCGIFNGNPVLDLDYDEDSSADADANFVLIEGGQIAEVQATAEGATYDEEALLRPLRLARIGCDRIFAAQAEAVK